MGSLGTPEILLILVVALLLFGPAKLPELGKSLGRAIKEFKRASNELKDTIEREVEDLKESADLPSAKPQSQRSKGVLPAPGVPRRSPPPPTVEETDGKEADGSEGNAEGKNPEKPGEADP